MNVLIIGGTGFISSTLVRVLLGRGHAVTLFTRGTREPDPDVRRAVKHIPGDRTNPASLAAAMQGRTFDAVFDLVAYQPQESAAAAKIFLGRVGRFIHCSTVSVYMVSDQVRCPITEDQHDRPLMRFWARNPFGMEYGIKKRECEDVLWRAHDERVFPVSMLRPAYVSGPKDPAKRDFFWIERMLDGGPLLVPGSGDIAFQQVYVEDVAHAFADLLDHPQSLGNAYNVVGEEIYSLNDYLNVLGNLLGEKPELVQVPQEVFDGLPFSSHPRGDVFTFNTRRTAVFSLDRIKRDLGFRSTPFDTWMSLTIDWWRSGAGGHSIGYERRADEIAFVEQHRKRLGAVVDGPTQSSTLQRPRMRRTDR